MNKHYTVELYTSQLKYEAIKLLILYALKSDDGIVYT